MFLGGWLSLEGEQSGERRVSTGGLEKTVSLQERVGNGDEAWVVWLSSGKLQNSTPKGVQA